MKNLYLNLFAGILAVFCLVLALDRFQLNSHYGKLRSKIDEKSGIIREQEIKFQQTLTKKDAEIQALKQRFHFVTEVLTPEMPEFPKKGSETEKETSGNTPSGMIAPEETAAPGPPPLPPFAQMPVDGGAGPRMVETLAGRVRGETPPPAELRRVFHAYLASDSRLPDSLRIHPDGKRVIDFNASLFEELCRRFGMTPATSLQWDMNSLTRRAVITVHSPAGSADAPAEIEFTAGNQAFQSDSAVVQNAPVSIVFPFDPVTLPGDGELELLLAMHELPVGGLYLHRVSVVCDDPSISEYLLEYELPDAPEELQGFQGPRPPAPENAIPGKKTEMRHTYHLQAVSLSGGTPVVSALSGNIQTFRAPLVNGRSELLISGDRVFLPKRVAILPFRQESAPDAGNTETPAL